MTAVPSHPAYRPDIDGLRAVAVLAVLFYHVGFAWLPGGYVGVDIFFVISGYLIGGIIDREVEGGRFSLGRFYVRRIRRIVPAFLAMCVATSVLSWLHLFPTDLVTFAKSLIAAALSVSNLYFYALAGYFDASASTQPLLHTWSLAVEEQFYVVLPLYALVAQRRFPRRKRAVLVWALLASLGLSSVLAFVAPGPAPLADSGPSVSMVSTYELAGSYSFDLAHQPLAGLGLNDNSLHYLDRSASTRSATGMNNMAGR